MMLTTNNMELMTDCLKKLDEYKVSAGLSIYLPLPVDAPEEMLELERKKNQILSGNRKLAEDFGFAH